MMQRPVQSSCWAGGSEVLRADASQVIKTHLQQCLHGSVIIPGSLRITLHGEHALNRSLQHNRMTLTPPSDTVKHCKRH